MTLPATDDLLPPPFADGARPGLLDLLPPLVQNPVPGRDVIVLLDGVGSTLLDEHRSITPTLRRLSGQVQHVRAPAPTTTSVSMVCLHTARAPIEHGVLGHMTFDPARGAAINQLTGAPDGDPRTWMPLRTPVEAGSRRAIQVGPAKHGGSHLSRVAYRGWEFLAHGRGDRVEAVRTALHRAGPDGLVHLHVDDADHAGHRHGVNSDRWREALAEVDALVAALLRRLPRGTRLHITADHGMVDTSEEATVDLAEQPAIQGLVRAISGEARALGLHAAPGDGAAEELAVRLEELLGERALVLRAAQLLERGVLGPPDAVVPPWVAPRIPDVLLLARGIWRVDDYSRREEPHKARAMIGAHGSLTAAEAVVPLLQLDV